MELKNIIEDKFEEFLIKDSSITSKEKAVRTRLSKARAVEEMLGENLDSIVADDDKMYNSLLLINSNMNNRNGAYSNALRKYYIFKNQKQFPRISDYKST